MQLCLCFCGAVVAVSKVWIQGTVVQLTNNRVCENHRGLSGFTNTGLPWSRGMLFHFNNTDLCRTDTQIWKDKHIVGTVTGKHSTLQKKTKQSRPFNDLRVINCYLFILSFFGVLIYHVNATLLPVSFVCRVAQYMTIKSIALVSRQQTSVVAL